MVVVERARKSRSCSDQRDMHHTTRASTLATASHFKFTGTASSSWNLESFEAVAVDFPLRTCVHVCVRDILR